LCAVVGEEFQKKKMSGNPGESWEVRCITKMLHVLFLKAPKYKKAIKDQFSFQN
jgi:hypothetical protein